MMRFSEIKIGKTIMKTIPNNYQDNGETEFPVNLWEPQPSYLNWNLSSLPFGSANKCREIPKEEEKRRNYRKRKCRKKYSIEFRP